MPLVTANGTRRQLPWVLALLVVSGILPVALGLSEYRLGELEYVMSVSMVAVGLNIVMGYAGQLSLGPSAIFAVGGYTAAVLANAHPHFMGLPLLALAAMLAAGVLGIVIGVPALRVGGFYLGMITLFLALLVPTIAGYLPLTGGSSGISLISNMGFAQVPSGMLLYEVTLLALAAIILLSWLLLYSRIGRRFVTLRSSEELAGSLGISGYRTKLLAFLLSALPAGLGGAFYVYTQQFFSSGSASTNLSIYLLAGCVIGGFGTVAGPILGALIVLGMSEFLGSLAQYQGIVFGVALIVIVLAAPEGIVGAYLSSRRPWPRAKRSPRAGVDRPRTARVVGGATRRVGLHLREQDLERGQSAESSEVDALERDSLAERALPEEQSSDRGGCGVGQFGVGAARGALRIEALKRNFGGVTALDAVTLRVAPGTVHALIGSNGSGKTTTLNIVSGFYRAHGGGVWLGGTRIDGHGPAFVACRGIARTFQTPKLLAGASVLENLLGAADRSISCSDVESLLRLPRGRRSYRQAIERAGVALEMAGIDEFADEIAGEVPHGTQRLVEVARAIALEPHFVLLDEPAAGLSPAEVDLLNHVVRAFAAKGVGVLLVEHNLPVVLELADEVTVLHHGAVIARGTPAEIVHDPQVAAAYLGSALARESVSDKPEGVGIGTDSGEPVAEPGPGREKD